MRMCWHGLKIGRIGGYEKFVKERLILGFEITGQFLFGPSFFANKPVLLILKQYIKSGE